jgi:hypothetical protein
LYAIAELYGTRDGLGNVGREESAEEQFRRAVEFERGHKWLRGRKFIRIADPAIFDRSRGDAISDAALRAGLTFYKANNNRLQGFANVQNRLRFDGNKRARLYVFRECKELIRTLPLLQFAGGGKEDVNSDGEDHAYDQLRYVSMEVPVSFEKAER